MCSRDVPASVRSDAELEPGDAHEGGVVRRRGNGVVGAAADDRFGQPVQRVRVPVELGRAQSRAAPRSIRNRRCPGFGRAPGLSAPPAAGPGLDVAAEAVGDGRASLDLFQRCPAVDLRQPGRAGRRDCDARPSSPAIQRCTVRGETLAAAVRRVEPPISDARASLRECGPAAANGRAREPTPDSDCQRVWEPSRSCPTLPGVRPRSVIFVGCGCRRRAPWR